MSKGLSENAGTGCADDTVAVFAADLSKTPEESDGSREPEFEEIDLGTGGGR
jgi:hypothetical protein